MAGMSAPEAELAKKELASAKAGFKLKGMNCAACAARIERGLSKMEGVHSARVNFTAESAAVEFDSNLVKPAEMIERIRQLGFDVPAERLDLAVRGMTCAACSARIEKKLKAAPGVAAANVNLAAEKASIEYNPAEISPTDLINTITSLGYEARLAGGESPDREKAEREREIKRQVSLFIFSAIFSAPLLVGMLGMIQPFHYFVPAFLHNSLFQFFIATPVQVVAGYHFYRDSYIALKEPERDMSVLVALGTMRRLHL